MYHEDTIYVELAEVVGIKDLREDELSPYLANTFGLGEVVKEAILKYQPKHIVFGLGGSASTDGGSGLLEALGAKFYEGDKVISNIDNAKLAYVTKVDLEYVKKLTKGIDALILTDVSNVLLGSNGAAHIFGPQKGASKEDVLILDDGFQHRKLHRDLDIVLIDSEKALPSLSKILSACKVSLTASSATSSAGSFTSGSGLNSGSYSAMRTVIAGVTLTF